MADSAYGLWPLVVVNTVLFALFTEMYGAPLTVYLLGSWLGSRFPALRATHAGGHLWNDLIGWKYDPHLSPFHLASYVLIGAGFWLIAAAWRVLHEAAQAGRLASTGPYGHVRHPQYGGLLLIMTGFLVQWPTIPTLAMFPVLVIVYLRLARSEEREVAGRLGDTWAAYAARTPAFIPAALRHPARGIARTGRRAEP